MSETIVKDDPKGYYTIVAPGTIQSDYAYDVTVTVHEHHAPATIRVGISGPSYNESQTVEVNPFSAEVVHFDVPTLESGKYHLQTEGLSGLIFKQDTELNYKSELPKVYIQTDKAQYKPGDLVQYRILALDENLKPTKPKQSLTLGIQDGAFNKIKQIKDLNFTKGVYSGKFQLSEQPVLGEWTIEVTVGKEDKSKANKKFKVVKYVLPKFSVELETDERVALLDEVVKITVRSRYTYGKSVKGTATITASVQYEEVESPEIQPFRAEKTIDIDGKCNVEFSIIDDLKMDQYRGYSPPQIRVVAVVTEALTGLQQKATATIGVERSRYEITVPQLASSYEINQPFEITAIIKKLNGSPVQDTRSTAKLIITHKGNDGISGDNTTELEFNSDVDNSGVATFKLQLMSLAYYHSVKVVYEEKVHNLRGFTIKVPATETPSSPSSKEQRSSPSEYSGPLKLFPQTRYSKLGEDIVIDVKSADPIAYFVYTVMARGKIFKHEYVKVEGDTKCVSIHIKATYEMTPLVKVYAYLIKDGELKCDHISIDIPNKFENKLEITAPAQAKPSDVVTLNVKTDPHSFVGLLGVDQSVLLLQKGNDFDEKQILGDLSSYDSNTFFHSHGFKAIRKRGFVTLTNVCQPEQEKWYRSCQFISYAYCMAGGSRLKMIADEPKIRKDFMDSWIFDSIESTDANGIANFTKKIPDTITSWVITGFSLNERTGFGMSHDSTKIRVFQPFFLSTNLPYSIKRGEVITIPITVFNYMESALDAQVTMENPDREYDFTEALTDDKEVAYDDTQRTKKVSIPSNSGETVSFIIRPNIVGEITLKIKAITPVAGDAMHQKLKVEPEGVAQYQNEAFFITIPNGETVEHTLKADIPPDVVVDSEYLEFFAVGDILGPTIQNIDKLVRMPYGCGEQNMINFVPNILVLHYLDAIKVDMPSVVEKTKNYMEKGYQRELTYKHEDGAYSAFGEGHSESNSWLTAYVARSFIQARKYITIDENIIEDALNYLITTQKDNGQFPQTGELFYSSNQNEVGVSAFIIIALLEDTDYALKYKSQIEKGLKYLINNIDREDDVYTLALVTLVFQKVKHSSVGKLLERLELKSNNENNLKWWGKSGKYHNNNIEITAYILQTLVDTQDAGSVLPIIKWLIAQRNSLGGFDSTQDTVVGLQALIKFAEKYAAGGSGKLSIAFKAQDIEGAETTTGSFDVDKENALLLQSHVLPKSTRQITLTANGQGSSLVQLSYRYNTATEDDKPSFLIDHAIKQSLFPGQLLMNVCAEYNPQSADDDNNESNMAVMEIYLPSGYTTDEDSLKPIRDVDKIQRVETKNDDTVVIVYFDCLVGGNPIRFDVAGEKTHDVAELKPAAITVYDYYSSYYTIVAPGTIQSDYAYDVTVTVHEHHVPATIRVGISGPSYNESQTVEVKPSSAVVIHFDVPTLECCLYQLQTEGLSGLIFKQDRELYYKSELPKVYIQTDKAQYKPGDLVQYRILALDENLKPAKPKQSLTLDIQDGAFNKIKQIKDIQFTKGVYSGKLQLSEQPVLGEWTIEVTEYIPKANKTFEVVKYVLPKFSVTLEADEKVSILDKMVKMTVRSRYTYGKSVKGTATITASVKPEKVEFPEIQPFRAEKTIDIDGKCNVEFSIMDDLKIDQHDGYSLPQIRVVAVVTEALTGFQQKATATICIERSRYEITVPQLASSYETNKPFEITAIIRKLNGSPVQDSKSMAKLIIRQRGNSGIYHSGDNTKELKFESAVDSNGVATFKLKLASQAYYHSVKVMYEEKVHNLPGFIVQVPASETPTSPSGIRQPFTPTQYFGPLKLFPQTRDPKVGEDIVIDVKSTDPISYFVYTVMARGKILKHEYVKVEGDTKCVSIQIKATYEMTPLVKVYAYLIKDGEFKCDHTSINIPNKFENKLEITAPAQAKPSDVVTLNIKTDPHSFVGLLGVDQSVLLLQTGNDLDEKQIFDDLSSYDSIALWHSLSIRAGRICGFVTLTNACQSQEPMYRSRAMVGAKRSTELLREQPPDAEAVSVPIQPKIRKDFVESWIFDGIESTDANGIANFTKKIPDTITSWVITGFSLNERTGFGMSHDSTKIRVFQPFFLSTNLPYSIKRGEVITIPITVFNYMESALDAQVTMENPDREYDFTEALTDDKEVAYDDTQRTKQVSIPSNSGETVSFTIRPNIVGELTLKIKAITPVAGDAMHQKLKVEPEGVAQYQNEAFFITIPNGKTVEHTLKADIPSDVVEDSEYLEFSAVGDILGPTIQNIDQLVRMPYGCGEQNMVNFVPNILVLHYLDVIKVDMPSIVEKAKNYMEKGYQRELTYKHKDGAYSAFGEGHSESNSWLTAYVARSFIQARKYITIGENIIEDALWYLIKTQKVNGQFPQTGTLFDSTNQNEVGVSAFIMLSLLEDTDYALKYKSQIEKGLKYLKDNIDREDDVYTLALVTLVFQKAKNSNVGKLMEKLELKSNNENNLKWWGKSGKCHNNNIEITAYILQTLVDTEDAGSVLPIIKWLIAQRNSLGGFESTQDTVVGLQALIKFAEKYAAGGSGKLSIAFKAQDIEGAETTTGSFDVDKENALLLQSHVLPKSTRQITLKANGQGSSLVQLAYRYNTATEDDKPSFLIDHAIKQSLFPGQLLMNVCAEYNPQSADDDNNESNMAVMEIYLPSGYTTDEDSLKPIRDVDKIQRVETKNDDTVVIVYFDSLVAGNPIRFDVAGEKTHDVAELKPAAITVYDYYNTEQRATVYYEVM